MKASKRRWSVESGELRRLYSTLWFHFNYKWTCTIILLGTVHTYRVYVRFTWFTDGYIKIVRIYEYMNSLNIWILLRMDRRIISINSDIIYGQQWHTLTGHFVRERIYIKSLSECYGQRMILECFSSIFVNCHARRGMSHFQGFVRGSRTSSTSCWKPVESSLVFFQNKGQTSSCINV